MDRAPFVTASSLAAERDADIVLLLADGEPERAFDRLMARYEAKVYRLCVALLREPAWAQDLAQDSLLRVWRALPRYDPGAAALSTWVYAITRNRCLTALARRPPLEVSWDEPAIQEAAERVAAPDPPAGADTGPVLRQLVDQLPEAQRRAITLYYFEERAVGEVAEMLGLPEGTVKTHLHRARATLRQRLA
jgi:RNA polymerase sigma-70 factor (ECF subfamily)